MSSFIESNTELVTTAATVLGIVLIAFVASQVVRRSIKKTLRSLSQGTVKERLGARSTRPAGGAPRRRGRLTRIYSSERGWYI